MMSGTPETGPPERNALVPSRPMRRCRIEGPCQLVGNFEPPPDAGVVEESLLLAALADGPSTLRGVSAAPPLWQRALQALGVQVREISEGLVVEGVGLAGLRMPQGALDCADDRRLLYRLAGLLAGQRFGTRLTASGPLACEPLEPLVEPLRARGAMIAAVGGLGKHLVAPISIAPLVDAEVLSGLRCELSDADSDLKAALLLSGLSASGVTAVWEPLITPDTLERMLLDAGLPVRSAGSMVGFDTSEWCRRIAPFDDTLPGSTSLAAIVSVAASILPNSRVRVSNAGYTPTRAGLFEGLRLMGGAFGHTAGGDRMAQPVAELQVQSAALRNITWTEDVLLRTGEEMPAIVALAAAASGCADIVAPHYFSRTGGGSARPWIALLGAFGITAEPLASESGLRVHGQRASQRSDDPLQPTNLQLTAHAADHPDLQMVAILLALASPGTTEVPLSPAFAPRYADMLSALVSLGARLSVERSDHE